MQIKIARFIRSQSCTSPTRQRHVPSRCGNRTDRIGFELFGIFLIFFGIKYRHPIPNFSKFKYPFRFRSGPENSDFPNFWILIFYYLVLENSDFFRVLFWNFTKPPFKFQNFWNFTKATIKNTTSSSSDSYIVD